MKRIRIAALATLALSCSSAHAQLALPGAPGATPAPQPAAHVPHKGARAPRRPAATLRAIAGKPLLLGGRRGQLLFSERDKTLRIDKLSLAGEVISNPSRKCRIDIVADAPIETKSLDKPDGLARFKAEIPACPFTFDVLNGAVLALPQDRACVFRAADCQATPAGLWGPDPSTLHDSPKALRRQRSRADSAAERSLRAIQTRLKGSPDADAVAHEDADVAGRRAEVCRDYAEEAAYGYCASRIAEARAALLKARLEALPRRTAEPK
jgi:hypothetical protein